MRNKNRRAGDGRQLADSVRQVQTKPTKAIVAAIITLAGLVGIHLTHGTAELLVGIVQLVLVVYGVWRTRNLPKSTGGPGVGEFL